MKMNNTNINMSDEAIRPSASFGKAWMCMLLLCLPLIWGCEEETVIPIIYGSISGLIVDEGSNVEIGAALVSSNPATSVLESDATGRFIFENIKTGTYTLRVEKEGYVTDLETVTVYEDQTASVIIKLKPDTLNNTAPLIPFAPSPQNGVDSQLTNVTLRWRSFDIDTNNTLRYDVFFFDASAASPILIASNITDTTYQVLELDYNSNYFWQIVAKDGTAAPVFGPIWSFQTRPLPDNRVVFTRATDGKYDIYSSSPIGTNILRLTNNTASNWRPHMNPARTKVAYLSNAGLLTQIRLMNRDGSDNIQLTSIPVAGFDISRVNFCWSPDGSKLLYTNNNKLYSINVDGTGTTQIATAPPAQTFSEVDWNGVTNQIAARTTGANIYNSIILLYTDAGVYVSQLQADAPGMTGGPILNVNGAFVLYSQDNDGFEQADGRQLNAHIYHKNIANGTVVDISLNKPNGTNDYDARYSPDGAKVIYTNTNNDGISTKSIWVVDLNSSNRTKIIDNAEMADWK